MIIYAAVEGMIVWSDNKRVHKAGRVHLHEPLTVIKQYKENWFKIERPDGLYLGNDPHPEPEPAYLDYWVHREVIIEELPESQPDPEPEPDLHPYEIPDEDVAAAILLILKWWRR